ncbi:uncharacterized protein [Paramisgurnus dabryanus]|uniref:uncharacterized protein n=1 Tax=Paramisgurnus dabryanus TaxID=90735 RepID=UPI0031F3DA53
MFFLGVVRQQVLDAYKMRSIIFCAIVLLIAVTGGVTDKIESVSLYEGDSVTLHTDIKLQRDDVIEWRFGDQKYLIARIKRVANLLKIFDDVLDGRFRDRLQLNDQTGDLTITDITTQHTGNYIMDIHGVKFTTKTFNISVSGDKVKTEMKGDSFILHNNVTKKPGDEKIVWRIKHNNSTVAEIIRNGKETNDEVHDERFSGRLKVNDQTGDLTITNIRPDDFGSYEVDITVGSHTYTVHRSFNVNVKGEDQSSSSSQGVIAGVCVVLLVLAVAVFLYRRLSRTTSVTTRERDGKRETVEEDEGPPINDDEMGKELTEMKKPLKTGSTGSTDVP